MKWVTCFERRRGAIVALQLIETGACWGFESNSTPQWSGFDPSWDATNILQCATPPDGRSQRRPSQQGRQRDPAAVPSKSGRESTQIGWQPSPAHGGVGAIRGGYEVACVGQRVVPGDRHAVRLLAPSQRARVCNDTRDAEGERRWR
jgi:hypothetical protein